MVMISFMAAAVSMTMTEQPQTPRRHTGRRTFLVWAIALGYIIVCWQIRPLLEKHCVSCHGAGKQKAGLKLDLGKRVLKGSLNGPVVIAKKSAESKLIHALKGEKGAEPKPGARFSAAS